MIISYWDLKFKKVLLEFNSLREKNIILNIEIIEKVLEGNGDLQVAIESAKEILKNLEELQRDKQILKKKFEANGKYIMKGGSNCL